MYAALLALTAATALQPPARRHTPPKLRAGFGAPTPKPTPKKEYSQKTLEKAHARFDELKAEHGNDPYRWRWGEVHPALNRHIPGSFIPGLAHLVTIKRPSSGANDTVNRGQMSIGSGEPFANIHAGGYRAVYDFSDLNASLYMSATGQSGNPFSAHWDDLADGWVEGTAFPIETDRERVTADSLGTFVLKPKGEEARQPDA